MEITAINVQCNTCGAKAGDRCKPLVGTTGREMRTLFHLSRKQLAKNIHQQREKIRDNLRRST